MTKILHVSNGTFLTVMTKNANSFTFGYTVDIEDADMDNQYDVIVINTPYDCDQTIDFHGKSFTSFLDYLETLVTRTSPENRNNMPLCIRNDIVNVTQMAEFEIIYD